MGDIMITARAIGLHHAKDITNTGQAIGSKEEMDGTGFPAGGTNMLLGLNDK